MTQAEYQREYYRQHGDALRARMRARYQAKKVEAIGKMREYAASHKEEIAAYQRQYQKQRRAERPEISKAAKHRRRAQVAECGGSYRPSDLRELESKQGNQCACCGLKFCKSRPYVVDHVMPIALKGRNAIENLQLLCRPCNRAKWHKHPDQWAQQIGRLFV